MYLLLGNMGEGLALRRLRGLSIHPCFPDCVQIVADFCQFSKREYSIFHIIPPFRCSRMFILT